MAVAKYLLEVASKARCPVEVVYACVVPSRTVPVVRDAKDDEIERLKAQLAAAKAPAKRAPKQKTIEATNDG